jgi:hypothetical protein
MNQVERLSRVADHGNNRGRRFLLAGSQRRVNFDVSHRGGAMNTRAVRFGVGSVIAVLTLILNASAVFSAEPTSPTHPAMTKEQREKMATIHEQIAACLRSEKPISECHKEAMKSCQDMVGKEGCSMMGGGMHEHMMQPSLKPDLHQ